MPTTFPSNGSFSPNAVISMISAGNHLIFDDSRIRLDSGYHYEMVRGDLFTRPVSLNDISQAGVGDCYLLAALQSLVMRDPNYIYNMMYCDNSHVWVKLFYEHGKAYAIRVEKNRFTSNRFSLKDPENNALWVQMIEKAYAALKIKSWSCAFRDITRTELTLLETILKDHLEELTYSGSKIYETIQALCLNSDSYKDMQIEERQINFLRDLLIRYPQKGTGELREKLPNTRQTLLEILDGGTSNDAFEKIFGKEGQRFSIARDQFFHVYNAHSNVPENSHKYLKGYHNLWCLFEPKSKPNEGRLNAGIRDVFNGDEARINEFKKYKDSANGEENGSLGNILDQFRVIKNNETYYKILRREDMLDSLEEYLREKISGETLEVIRQYVIDHCPLKRGKPNTTNQINANSLVYFGMIADSLKEGRLVCVGTYGKNTAQQKYWRPIGHRLPVVNSIREAMQLDMAYYKGLRPSHIYSVLAMVIIDSRAFLLLCNPHRKSYKRQYYTNNDPNKQYILSTKKHRILSYQKLILNYQNMSDFASGFDINHMVQENTDENVKKTRCLEHLLTRDNIFVIESHDLTNRFSHLYISDKILPTS